MGLLYSRIVEFSHRATVGSGLDYVEFFASHEAEDLRIWRIAAHDLVITFEIVESSESRATPHSIRSASSGSIAEARRAGK